MIGYVNNVETLLIKSLITSTFEKTSATLQEAWRQVILAQAYLGQLPVSQHILATPQSFFHRWEILYLSNNNTMGWENISDKDYETIEEFIWLFSALGKSLNELQDSLLQVG